MRTRFYGHFGSIMNARGPTDTMTSQDLKHQRPCEVASYNPRKHADQRHRRITKQIANEEGRTVVIDKSITVNIASMRTSFYGQFGGEMKL